MYDSHVSSRVSTCAFLSSVRSSLDTRSRNRGRPWMTVIRESFRLSRLSSTEACRSAWVWSSASLSTSHCSSMNRRVVSY